MYSVRYNPMITGPNFLPLVEGGEASNHNFGMVSLPVGHSDCLACEPRSMICI
jgi:hypothetical protein